MNERVAISQSNSLQLANLVRSHAVRVTKPQSDQAISLDLNNGAGARLDLSAVANEKMTLVHVDTKLVILHAQRRTIRAECSDHRRSVDIADQRSVEWCRLPRGCHRFSARDFVAVGVDGGGSDGGIWARQRRYRRRLRHDRACAAICHGGPNVRGFRSHHQHSAARWRRYAGL